MAADAQELPLITRSTPIPSEPVEEADAGRRQRLFTPRQEEQRQRGSTRPRKAGAVQADSVGIA